MPGYTGLDNSGKGNTLLYNPYTAKEIPDETE